MQKNRKAPNAKCDIMVDLLAYKIVLEILAAGKGVNQHNMHNVIEVPISLWITDDVRPAVADRVLSILSSLEKYISGEPGGVFSGPDALVEIVRVN